MRYNQATNIAGSKRDLRKVAYILEDVISNNSGITLKELKKVLHNEHNIVLASNSTRIYTFLPIVIPKVTVDVDDFGKRVFTYKK